MSGSGDHADCVERLLAGRGFDVERTDGPSDAVAFGRPAVADGVSEVWVRGSDGTVNEVVRGLANADGLDAVTLSVVPVGTANLLAGNVGVDVGVADGEPFLVSTMRGSRQLRAFPRAAT